MPKHGYQQILIRLTNMFTQRVRTAKEATREKTGTVFCSIQCVARRDSAREREREGVEVRDNLRFMSRLPYPTVEHYNSMYAYGYHFRTDSE